MSRESREIIIYTMIVCIIWELVVILFSYREGMLFFILSTSFIIFAFLLTNILFRGV